MPTGPYYVICCRCAKPDSGYITKGKNHTILHWWLWCKDCVQEMRKKAQGAHA